MTNAVVDVKEVLDEENMLLVYFMFQSILVILKQYKISQEKTKTKLFPVLFF